MSDGFFKRTLVKPDGRKLHLYSRRQISEEIVATSPKIEPILANPHMRWHPLRAEWVAYASHRQSRTFLPPKEYNPLMPSRTADFPTELPAGDYDAAVFENLFPSFSPHAHSAPQLPVPTAPAQGVCEVVVFTQDPTSSLSQLPLDHLRLLLRVWSDRYLELAKGPDVAYIMPFENKGVEVGVTLPHPHGQIYAYPVVPAIPANELSAARKHFDETGRPLLEELLNSEIADGRRVIFQSPQTIAFVPVCARYPYEVWLAPRRRVGTIGTLNEDELADLARALKTVLMKYDGLWNRPFPYVMVMHQAPTRDPDCAEAHLHFEFYPPYRTADRLKYLAGTELGAGLFTNDALPEEKAAELQSVRVEI
jgi:UDPglucose--hexose-1-phosphate uridylyltransferase